MTSKEILRKYWGFTDFRGIQEEVIESISAGRDTLGLMPTGGGKSLTFQIPALAAEGVCLVVTPLISLMKDQVDRLRKQHIRAAAIYSGMSHSEVISTLENCIFGAIKLLYVSPERLGTELFRAKLRHMKVSFIAVDEAHCISQWGYDFRPAYLQIVGLRKLVPHAPVLALTATATPRVVKDIQQQLGFGKENVFKMSFERGNLAYVVRRTENKIAELLHILRSVQGTAIVYCRSRERTKIIAETIAQSGIGATWYHAGLEHSDKEKRQNAWQNGEVRVIVATNAFGMGIDKANVRLVIHADFPSSFEAYFQEAGRAGRDGKKSYAVLLYTPGVDEQQLEKRGADNFPPKDYIRTVYDHLAYFYQIGVGSGYGTTKEFPIEKFCTNFKHFPTRLTPALHILSRAGYIDYEENPDTKPQVHFLLGRDELYRLDALSENENKVITSLLRNYGGLFSEMRYIEEAMIADETGLERNDVYMTLKGLNKKRIINFIPRKKIPLITYTRDREDGKDIVIAAEVYEQRKDIFVAQLRAMIQYAQHDDECRSRALLKYFGEERTDDCGTCDVCLDRKPQPSSATSQARSLIRSVLADGKKHSLAELEQICHANPDVGTDTILGTLQDMIEEEETLTDDSNIVMSKQ